MKTNTHESKRKILEERQRATELNRSRQSKIGMNVFREHYQGIKQSKSRLDFEKDMLRAKLCDSDVGDSPGEMN